MAVFDGSDLKNWRKAQGVTAEELAARVSCDETTIFRYESGKLKPNPDVMHQICAALGDTRNWEIWMRTEYPSSYGREHPEPTMYGLEGTVLRLLSEVRDLEKLKYEMIDDAADGVIDCERLREDLLKEITELIKAAQSAKVLLERGHEDA